MPAVFVPVAEDSGQIIPLSLWVLDTACAQLRQLGEQGITGISMAVNISPMHLEIATDHHDAAITQGIISMAHHLSLTVVAEGVETASQVDFLKGSRCDISQGYYFAKPMPYAEIEAFLSQPAQV